MKFSTEDHINQTLFLTQQIISRKYSYFS